MQMQHDLYVTNQNVRLSALKKEEIKKAVVVEMLWFKSHFLK